MMRYWGDRGVMNWSGGFVWYDAIGFVFCLVIFIDLVLLGLWLWKQINKK